MSVAAAALQILHYPAPQLRRRAEPVGEIDASVQAVAARMIALMREANGLGLAAPQVGMPWRMFVTNGGEDHPDRVYINPTLSVVNTALVLKEEGCLSLPGINVELRRPKAATINALNLAGQPFELSDDDVLARIWQHELDHLEGILIIDRMSPMDRLATRKILKELEATAAGA